MLEIQTVKNKMEAEEGMNHLSILMEPEARPENQLNETERKPVAFFLVLDTSGSMNEAVGPENHAAWNHGEGRQTKIDYLKEACEKQIDLMTEQDMLGIVSFSSSSRIEYPLSPMTLETKHAMKDRVRMLSPRGGTNVGEGLQSAFNMVTKDVLAHYQVKILLLSDGVANTGIVDEDQISSLASEFSQKGVSISTIGIGNHYNSFYMESIATASGAMFYHLKEMSNLEEIFKNELHFSHTLNTNQVSLTIELPKGVFASPNLNGFSEQNGQIFIGNLYQTQQVLIEFHTEKAVETGKKEIVVRMDYQDAQGTAKTVVRSLEMWFVEEEEMDDADINPELAEKVKIYMEAQMKKHSLRFYEKGRLSQVKQDSDSQLNHLKKMSKSYQIDVSGAVEEVQSLTASMMNSSLDASETKSFYSASYDLLRNKKEQ